MLRITNKEYYEQIVQTAQKRGILHRLQHKLEYLRHYGCSDDDPDRCMVDVGWDFAPMSFSLMWYFRTEEGNYKHWFSGGLIFYEKDQDWGVHT